MDANCIQSLHFCYVLQEDSVRISKQLVQFSCIRPDDVVFRPDAHLSASSVQTTRTSPPELQSMSKNFKLFESCITFQQHVQTPFSVQQVK